MVSAVFLANFILFSLIIICMMIMTRDLFSELDSALASSRDADGGESHNITC